MEMTRAMYTHIGGVTRRHYIPVSVIMELVEAPTVELLDEIIDEWNYTSDDTEHLIELCTRKGIKVGSVIVEGEDNESGHE
jgi:hypothetical protein